jgi:hypothetical protein
MMSSERILPDDPLGFIRRCVEQRKVYWTYHGDYASQGTVHFTECYTGRS